MATSFAGLGEEPQVLVPRAPELLRMKLHCRKTSLTDLIAGTYPRVVQGVLSDSRSPAPRA
jgi:hypothetical protein